MSVAPHPPGQPLAQMRLSLRPEVRCAVHQTMGAPFYLLEDTLQSRFFRVGRREWALVGRMDGRRTVGEIVAESREELGEAMLSDAQVATLCQWMLQSGLVVAADQPSLARHANTGGLRWLRDLLASPLFVRIPLFQPDRAIAAALPWLRWTISTPGFFVWLLAVGLGAAVLMTHREEFFSGFEQILSPHNWIWLLAGWIGLKVVHELYHGLVCKKYGGHVSRCGILLILFSPVAFVDVSSCWRFRNKWHRVFTAAAGMYAEFFIAALAAMVWVNSNSPMVRHVCHGLVMMASIGTVLFNANFLMRFDGYYIVADLLEIQNLYSKGRQYLGYLFQRYLLGLPARDDLGRGFRSGFIRLYAFASLGWRILFYVGTLWMASHLFHGFGLVLAAVTAVAWFVPPLVRWITGLRRGGQWRKIRWGRLAAGLTGFATAITLLLAAPWPGSLSAPAVVEYSPLSVVRVRSPGFVAEVCVEAGQRVRKGDVLVQLYNPETERRHEDVLLRIEQCRLRARILHQEGKMAEYQAESRRLEALEAQRKHLAAKVDQLAVRADCDGRVIGRRLDSLVGQYVQDGQELMAVGLEARKQLQVALAQDQLEAFREAVGQKVGVVVGGFGRLAHGGVLVRINPRASTHVPHPSLISTHGGPLTVVTRESPSAERSTPTLELVQPYFTAIVEPAGAGHLRAGQLARVWLDDSSESVARRICRWLVPWLDAKRARAER